MDLQAYHRRLKILSFFEKRPSSTITPFTPRSVWTPGEAQIPTAIKNNILNDVQYFDKRFAMVQLTHNLSSVEIRALKRLRNNRNIIIKPADKGSAVDLMDRFQYLWEGHRQLSDSTYYQPLQKPIFLETVPLVQHIIQKLYQKKYINHKQKLYLMDNRNLVLDVSIFSLKFIKIRRIGAGLFRSPQEDLLFQIVAVKHIIQLNMLIIF